MMTKLDLQSPKALRNKQQSRSPQKKSGVLRRGAGGWVSSSHAWFEPRMENQTEKKMENEMETGVI